MFERASLFLLHMELGFYEKLKKCWLSVHASMLRKESICVAFKSVYIAALFFFLVGYTKLYSSNNYELGKKK